MIRSENIVFLSANHFTIPRISMKTAYFTHKMQEKIPQLMWQLELWRLGPECFKNRRSSQGISANMGNDPDLGHTASSFMKMFERATDTLMETQSCIVDHSQWNRERQFGENQLSELIIHTHFHLVIMDSLYLYQNTWDGIIHKVILLYGSCYNVENSSKPEGWPCKQEYHTQYLSKFSTDRE